MGEPDKSYVHGVEAHHLGRDGIYGDLIGPGENDVLLMPPHGARSGAVAREGPVGHGEDAGVYLLLDVEEIDERLVNDRVRPVGVCGLGVHQRRSSSRR